VQVLSSFEDATRWLKSGGGKKAKVILFTDKKKDTPPLWKLFSRIFKNCKTTLETSEDENYTRNE
jgi:hypothetical protein